LATTSAPPVALRPASVLVTTPEGTPARRSLFAGGRLYLWLALLALGIGACSLLIPSTPSYDPWAWLVWGREIIHLNLQTTGGPSWKPLPMIFTTTFAPLGRAAPDLWLVIARAGALLAVAMAFKLAWRLTHDLTARANGPAVSLAPLLAGVIAAGSLINSGGFITDNALGYSEGLAAALMLIAVDRYLDRAPRQAFVVGFFASLDRPELWIFWVPYGLFLLRRDRAARKLVLWLFAVIPVLWFAPELWGSGQLLRNVTRALHPRSNSAAFARCPVCTVFRKEAWPEVVDRVKVLGILALLTAGAGLSRARAAWLHRSTVTRAIRARAWLLAIGLFGYVWWVGIAVETQAGFSGNDRYLLLGTAPVAISGAIGWGWFAHGTATVLGRLAGRMPSLSGMPSLSRTATRSGMASLSRMAGPAATALAVGLFMTVPAWIGGSIISLPRLHGALVYQAHLRQDMAAAIKRLGRQRILGCGTVMTEGFQVPMLAYMLDVHTLRVQEPPAIAGTGPPPNTIFQTRAQRNSTLLPIIRPWHVRYSLVDDQRTFRVFMNCTLRSAI
jgi:hypothetical protein